jgi:hypothetical protein
LLVLSQAGRAVKKDIGGAKKCANVLAFAEGFDFSFHALGGQHV